MATRATALTQVPMAMAAVPILVPWVTMGVTGLAGPVTAPRPAATGTGTTATGTGTVDLPTAPLCILRKFVIFCLRFTSNMIGFQIRRL